MTAGIRNRKPDLWLLWALIMSAVLITNCVRSQNIVLSGTIANADTTNITVWSNGDLILQQQTTDQVYALILGEKPHYTISFQCFDTIKYATLITYKIENESLELAVDFNVRSHVLITKEKTGFKRSIIHRYYGSHGYRKKF